MEKTKKRDETYKKDEYNYKRASFDVSGIIGNTNWNVVTFLE